MRDDKGGEYSSTAMDDWYKEHGISRQHTVRNRPQQNGVAERSNRTAGEGIVAMLQEANLPASFWGEALSAFVHCRNRSTTSAVKGATPYELFYGKKPDVLLMCIFRRTREHPTWHLIWRRVCSLVIRWVIKATSSTFQPPRRQLSVKEQNLMRDTFQD